jgi:hypothetical protein
VWNIVEWWLDRDWVDSRPPDVKSKKLVELARAVRGISDQLYDDPTASRFADYSIQSTLRARQVQYCEKLQIDPLTWADKHERSSLHFSHRLDTMCGDHVIAERLLASLKLEPLASATEWDQLPDLQRFALWTKETGYLRLHQLLAHLADELETRSAQERELEILQGRRSKSGLRLGLMRTLIGYVLDRYGKQLDQAIAAVLSAVEDREIGPDHVGPERRRMIRRMSRGNRAAER